jgi:hypothetical protein
MLTEIMRQRAAAEHFPLLGYLLLSNLRAQSANQDSAEARNKAQLA